MKRFAITVLAVLTTLWAGSAVCAQRSTGHAGSGFHGGVSAPASHSFSGSRSATAGRAASPSRSSQRTGASNFRRPPYRGPWRYRQLYRTAYPYYGVGGWVGPGLFLGYSDDSGDDTSSGDSDQGNANQKADDANQGPYDQGPYGQGAYDQGPYNPAPYNPSPNNQAPYSDQANYQGAPPPYTPYPAQAAPAPSESIAAAAPQKQEKTTLIFKDGRPAERISNYILTRDTIYVGDRRPSEIPLDELDLAATAKVNREAGVDFRLPESSR